MNFFEAKYINEELQLTYDKDGNIVSINNMQDETENAVCKEPENESNTDK